MKFLERVFDPLGDKQVPLMALATSLPVKSAVRQSLRILLVSLSLTPGSPRPWSSNRSSQTCSHEPGMVAMAERDRALGILAQLAVILDELLEAIHR